MRVSALGQRSQAPIRTRATAPSPSAPPRCSAPGATHRSRPRFAVLCGRAIPSAVSYTAAPNSERDKQTDAGPAGPRRGGHVRTVLEKCALAAAHVAWITVVRPPPRSTPGRSRLGRQPRDAGACPVGLGGVTPPRHWASAPLETV